jgi:hypothetical protein
MPARVYNVIVVPTCRRERTSIDEDRFMPTLRSTMYLNGGSIMMRRGIMCALGPMRAEGMVLHAVMNGNLIWGVARGMAYATMFVDNRPMACNCGGSLTDGGIPAWRDMERQVRMLRGPVPRFSEYCRGDHTSMMVADMDVACAVH